VGEVLAFRRPGGPSSASPAPVFPAAPSTALAPARDANIPLGAWVTNIGNPVEGERLWSIWSDPASWETSAKGNPFVRFTNKRTGREFCVTIFPRRGAFAWCIARDGEPIWSPVEYGAEAEARDAAWLALEELEGVRRIPTPPQWA